MAAVITGIDRHKASHTAVVISAAEEAVGELRVRASATGDRRGQLVLPASRLRRLHPGRSSPHPAETRADPQHQLIERPEPAIGAYAVASGHRKIVLSPHKP